MVSQNLYAICKRMYDDYYFLLLLLLFNKYHKYSKTKHLKFHCNIRKMIGEKDKILNVINFKD